MTRYGMGLWLVALALLLKVIVPPGMMFAADREAGFQLPRMIICTGNGPREVAAPAASHGNAAPDDTSKSPASDQPCAFAALVAMGAPSLGADIAAPLLIAAAAPLAHIAQIVGQGLATPPPPATGPPAIL